jgi:hypothetical protein
MFLVVEGLQYITVPRCLAFFFLRVGSPIYTHRWEEGKNFGTRIWDKVRCYWEHYGELEEHYWERMGEHDGNTIIKISTSQQITPLPPTPPLAMEREKMNPLECMFSCLVYLLHAYSVCRLGCHHFPDSANTPFLQSTHHTYSNMRFVTHLEWALPRAKYQRPNSLELWYPWKNAT